MPIGIKCTNPNHEWGNVGDHYRCVTCWRTTNQKWRDEVGNARCRERNAQLRLDALEAYGGECRCCGITEPIFLTFNHVSGDGGGRNRGRSGGDAGWRLYSRLVRERDPNIEVLCFNCNYAEYHGGCPGHWI